MKERNFFLLLIFISTSFFSCRKDLEKPSWDTEVITPLVNASLDINNLLPDSILQANADSSLKIVYQNDIYNLKMDTLFKIPDTTIIQNYNIPFPYSFTPSIPIVNNTITETRYQLPNVELRTLMVKSGKVKYTIKSQIHEVTHFVYSIPCATLGGNAFTINVDVPAAVGSNPGIFDQVFDLSGYTIDLTGIAHNKINTIYTSLLITVGATVLVNPTDTLSIENKFFDIIPYYAKGYFGQASVNIGPETSDFTMFNRITGGTLRLEDVDFNLQIENPIGMDARMFISNLKSINTRTNTTVDLSNALIGAPINLNRGSESGSGLGNVFPTYANFPLNVSNSNIKEMIENLPDKFGYSLQLQTNPLGNISGSNDFIYSEKLLKASLNMEIPLSLCATNLTLADTLDLNIANTNGTQDIKSGTLTLFAENGFPFDASLQMYLLNEYNVETDSIFGYANTIDEAPVNSALRAVDTKLSKIVIPVSETKMNLIYRTPRIALRIKFNTAAHPNYVKIYSNYKIDVRLVGDINYTVHLK